MFNKELQRQFLGFDEFFNKLHKAIDNTEKFTTYPPYNVRKIDNRTFMLEVAVAGFSKDDIDITIEENNLTIKGKKTVDSEVEYLYKGIADRTFVRNYILEDTVEIKNASILDGVLYVLLENVIPEEKKLRKISISEVSSENKNSFLLDLDTKGKELAESTAEKI